MISEASRLAETENCLYCEMVEAYRNALADGDGAKAQQLSVQWAVHNVCDIDELHEMAFGCLEG